MRGTGQIAELCEIAEPDVAAITNVGPVHVELLGSVEAIAAAKAEILRGLPAGRHARSSRPRPEALEPHLGDALAADHASARAATSSRSSARSARA